MTIKRRPDTGRWQARYRDPSGREHAKDFDTQAEAKVWKQEQERAVRRREWTDPSAGRLTVGQLWPEWLSSRPLKPKTRATYESLWASCVGPRWGRVRLDQVTALDVRKWVTNLEGVRTGQTLSASRRVQAHGLLARILDAAVDDGRIPKNPARAGRAGFLPPVGRKLHGRPLTHAEVDRLAAHAAPHSELVLTLAYCGLRWGEAVALRVCDLDLLWGRIHVRQSVAEVHGQMVYGAPKTHQQREVVMPSFLRPMLTALIDGKGERDLVFTTPSGAPLRNNNFRTRTFLPALAAAGLPVMRIHDLRHTAAALAIDSSANVKGVQRMLGHKDATVTLNTYADLFDGHLAAVADRLDEARNKALADSVRTEPATVVPLKGVAEA